ncbi:GEVED domain-containing protein [Taibaiella chishuiensis]|uniref:Putative secreted protein (Por secretion system target) n=1 Tax=Taibaiella chishuiensis TaxID=1434707 RepID=A0A2P8DBP8_9BACT|nr:GEVED domain-containing protein [Taibaiella chishuiensis]PSK94639.1 putative secreted protein (Por secretion system target) [Taibaiella chishuiensis]
MIQPYFKRSLKCMLLCLPLSLSLSKAGAQTYCTPQVTATNFYISNAMFNYGSPGVNWPTGNNGYSATLSSSSKTIPRYYTHTAAFWYYATNTTAAPITVYIRFFADWNHDGDFSDPGETGYSAQQVLAPNTGTGTGYNVYPPLNALTGTTRVRIILSQNSDVTDPCAPVTGEVEDYIFTIQNSSAPVLSTTANVFLNSLLTTQTASEGFTINQLITGSQPDMPLITDPDDSTGYYVPRGIAITGATGTGTWQYKATPASTWTNVGAVTGLNALLLMGDAADNRYLPGGRLRFIPTGAGNPALTFRAWDGTTGTHGAYGTAVVSGGTSAFSTAVRSVSLPVVTANPTRHFYMASASADNILASFFDPAGGLAYTPATIVSDNTNLTNVTDIDLDAANNRLVWTESAVVDKIVSADFDGSNVTVLYTFPTSGSAPNGIAIGGGKMFYTDNGLTAKGVYKATLSGGGNVRITGNAGQLAMPNQVRDIEYYNNKLYVIARATPIGNYSVYQMDTTGANPVEVVSTPNVIQHLEVAAGNVYWTELVNNNAALYVKPIAGTTVTTLATGTGRQFRDIEVDSANNKVYYIDLMSGSAQPADRALMAVPMTGGSPVKVLSLPENYITLVSDIAPTALAITLQDFSGKALARTNHLQWQVGNEGPGARYTLERSADGTTFAPLALIAGKAAHQYQYEDANPLPGVSFYRLHLQDAAGQDSYSKTIALQRSAAIKDNILVYPNPVTDVVKVLGDELQLLELYNIMGQKVAAVSGANSLSMAHLPAGIYNLRITLAGTETVISQRVIKQ